MGTFKILMPYNYSTHDKKAIQFIINAFGGRDDVSIALFHSYTSPPDIDVTASPEIKKMSSGMTYLASELSEKEKGLKEAGRLFLESGFPEDALDYIFRKKKRSTADEIVDTATSGRYDAVVLSRRGGRVTQFFSRSIHTRAIFALKNITVCIAA